MRLSFILICLCLLAPGARAQSLPRDAVGCSEMFAAGQPPALTNPKLAARTTLLCNDAYAALASGVTKGPLWSAERLTRRSVGIARGTPREGEFHADERVPPADRSQLDDYRGSGFDRGHMAPSGDMPGPSAQQQSFALSNMVPQAQELNRGLWSDIEQTVRGLATRRGTVFVVTGPAFVGAEVRAVGNGVLVPSGVWKAVFDPQAGLAGVYACSNRAAAQCAVVSVAQLTAMTGIDPFPALPASVRDTPLRLPRPIPHRRPPNR